MRENSILIFGNGLGRAIDNDYYDLKTAFRNVWEKEDYLTNQEKEMIRSCLPELELQDNPSDEQQLLNAQLAVRSYNLLSSSIRASALKLWVTENAVEFSSTLHKLNSSIARYFHETSKKIPDEFAEDLVNYVTNSHSHVATLNYDPLLYDLFTKRHRRNGFDIRICNDFKGDLIDGFSKSIGFSEANFLNKHGRPFKRNEFGYFLHLHGTPLFAEKVDVGRTSVQNVVHYKMTREQMRGRKSAGNHVVLTHGSMKPSIIEASPILSLYWRKLNMAMAQSSEILLFGYSGADEHLNDAIRIFGNGAKKRVVEWENPTQTTKFRQKYWEFHLGSDVEVIRKKNVLSFREWQPTI